MIFTQSLFLRSWKLSKSNCWLALAPPPPQNPPNLLRSHHHSSGPGDHPRDASQEITGDLSPRTGRSPGSLGKKRVRVHAGQTRPSRRLGTNLEIQSPMSHHGLALHVLRLPHFRCDSDTRRMRCDRPAPILSAPGLRQAHSSQQQSLTIIGFESGGNMPACLVQQAAGDHARRQSLV
jgi:hypothetical protein